MGWYMLCRWYRQLLFRFSSIDKVKSAVPVAVIEKDAGFPCATVMLCGRVVIDRSSC